MVIIFHIRSFTLILSWAMLSCFRRAILLSTFRTHNQLPVRRKENPQNPCFHGPNSGLHQTKFYVACSLCRLERQRKMRRLPACQHRAVPTATNDDGERPYVRKLMESRRSVKAAYVSVRSFDIGRWTQTFRCGTR